MKILRYLIFLVFNHYYRDGNYKEDSTPYFTSAGTIMVYECMLIIVAMHFINKYIPIYDALNTVLTFLHSITYGVGFALYALLYPVNYYFLIKRGGFNRIYREFNHAKINTKRNRTIGHASLILYLPIMCVIIGHLKFWFP